MYFDEYKQAVLKAINEAYDGIDEYAYALEDLSGLVLDPIGRIRELTEQVDLPSELSEDDILEYVGEAEDGAERYAETLEDTTDCTYPLDKLAEYLGIEFD